MELETDRTRSLAQPHPPPAGTRVLLPVLVSVLALAAVVAATGFFEILITGVIGIPLPAPDPTRPLRARDFVVIAVATDLALLVVGALLLGVYPGRTRTRIRLDLTARALRLSFVALAAVLVVNALGAWIMSSRGEVYTGLPRLPGGWKWLVLLLTAAAMAPVAEELFFREALLSRVFAASARPLAIVLASAAFGLLHAAAGGPVLVLALTFMGIVLAILRVRTGSLGPSILVHAANNLLAICFAGASGG